MLLIIGRIAGFDQRTGVDREGKQFTTQQVGIETGDGMHKRVEVLNLGREFFWDGGNPGEGAEVALQVGIRAWAGRNGAGYSLTAYDDVSKRVQLAAPSKA